MDDGTPEAYEETDGEEIEGETYEEMECGSIERDPDFDFGPLVRWRV